MTTKLKSIVAFGVMLICTFLFFMKKENLHPYPQKWDRSLWKVASYYDFYRIPDIYYSQTEFLSSPLPTHLNLIENEKVACYLDRLEKVGNILKVRGWCYLQTHVPENIYLYFVNNSDTLIFRTFSEMRVDVQQSKELARKDVGIAVDIQISAFPAGTYDLYVGPIQGSAIEAAVYTTIAF